MNNQNVGLLLRSLRQEKNMTQKQIANMMHISDKTISKWERGLGCPDVSLLGKLSNILEVNIERMLAGNLEQNQIESGNIKRIKFYVCPNCGNVITSTGHSEISCCGRKLFALKANVPDQMHQAKVEEIDGEYYVTFQHEMSKAHYISFLAYVTGDSILLIKLYPEQTASVRFPK
ncbi:XRE family transcriptional regulator, partial [Lachnotalea glycerini]